MNQDRVINKMPINPLTANPKIIDFNPAVRSYCQTLKINNYKIDLRTSKVVIVGNVSTGKTSLVQRFVKDYFNSDYKSTIGVDFEVENFSILNVPFNLQIWDTAGQERFRCIAAAYYRGSQSIIVTFDLTDRESLHSVEAWLNEALKANKFDEQPQFVFIVGTKMDLIEGDLSRNELHLEAVDLASRLNADYWTVSSLTGENVNQLFSRLASVLFNESIRKELETESQTRTVQRSIGNSQITSSECIKLSVKKHDSKIFDFLIEKKWC